MGRNVLAILVILLSDVPKLVHAFMYHPSFHGGHPSTAEPLVKTTPSEAAEPESKSSLVPSPPPVQDKAVVAFAELKIKRFGHKCKEREKATSENAQAVVVTTTPASMVLLSAEKRQTDDIGAISSPPVLLQIGSEDSNSSNVVQPIADSMVATQQNTTDGHIGDVRGSEANGPSISPTRQVGEVALQENGTVPEPASSIALTIAAENALPPLTQDRSIKLEDQIIGVGFSADPQALPILSDVGDLAATSDPRAAPGEHIHVTANVATQDVTASATSSNKAMTSSTNSTAAVELGQNLVADAAANASLELATNATSEAVVPNMVPEKVHVQSQTQSQDEQVHGASLSPVVVAAPTRPGFLIRHRLALVLLVVITSIALMSGLCLITGFLASFLWQRQCGSPTRSRVEELAICRAAEVERKLPASGGYDCIFSKPLSSCELLRLEARVEGPCATAAELSTPLTKQACVLYSVAVSRQLHDGMHPVPVAFSSASVDFVISLRDSPQTRITLRGEDVSLFDVHKGRCVQRKSFAAAPEQWQDFVLTHRAAAPGNDWQTSSHLRSDGSLLEFQECALLVGMLATFVGELHRGADGTLTLRPLQVERSSADISGAHSRLSGFDVQERWRTSWECDGCEAVNVASHPASPREGREDSKVEFAKVLASDDVQLLESSGSVLGSAAKLLRRLAAKGLPGRAFSFVYAQHRCSFGNSKGITSESRPLS